MKMVLDAWLSPRQIKIRLHPKITTFLYVEYGGEISSIGFGFDKKTWNEIRSNSSSILETLNKFHDDFDEIQQAVLWNRDFHGYTKVGVFEGTREEYLTQCEKDLKNKYLSQSGKQEIQEAIARIEKRIQEEIYYKLQRKEFADIRKRVIGQLLEVAGYKCQARGCRKRDDLTVDHIIPITRGGKNEVINFQILCRSCNASKNNQLAHEWEASRKPTANNQQESEVKQ